MKYFLISNILLFLASCSTFAGVNNIDCTPAYTSVWTDELRSMEATNKYKVTIEVNNNRISGICMLKKVEEGWRGTLVNEFGAKAFDFRVTEKKCELLNTISMMNKWYIRKTIASDLHYLFEIDNPHAPFQKKTIRCMENDIMHAKYAKKKQISRYPEGRIIQKNLKYHIVYTLEKLPE